MPLTPSTRWCPTPEQLMILEEMYRSGIRTPSASQIQQITAHLSLYGKIEGKNVFYWFQNHKARDRQKLRKKLGRHHQLLQQPEAAPEPSAPPHFYPQITSSVLYQGCFHGATTSPGLNLLEKLEAAGSQEEHCPAPVINPTALNRQWTAVMMDVSSPFPQCCEPPKTLDLFPVRSTGIKEDCGFSKSSSCSTSTS